MNRALALVLSLSGALALHGCCWGPNAKTAANSATAQPEAPAAEEPAWPAMPTPGPAPSFEVPSATSFTLANGIPVTLVTTGAVPLVELQINLGVGYAGDPKGKEGLAALTADMLNEGAGDFDALGIEDALQRLATDLSFGADVDSSQVHLNALEDKLQPSLELLVSMLSEPTLAKDDLDRVIEDRKRALLSAKDDLPSVGRRVFNRVLFGDGYHGRPGSGTEDSLSAITRKDVTGWHRDVWSPKNASLIVVSRMDEAAIKPILDATLGAWTANPKSKTPTVDTTVAEAKSGITVYWVDKPGQSQSYIRLGSIAPGFDAETHHLRQLGNHPIGGNFTARINMNLREDKGYTYGARSFFGASRHAGYFGAASSVRADATAASITEFLAEIRGALGDKPVTDEEHARSVGSLVQAEPGNYERMASVLGQFANADDLGYPDGYLQSAAERYAATTREQAQAAFAAAVSGNDLAIVVVGDRAAAGPAVEELGFPIVAVDDEGMLLEE